jgi:dihydroorotase
MLPYFKAPSGLPLIQYSLLAVLELVHRNELTIENAITALCHNTALRFNVSKRGFIKEGYFADIVIIDPNKKHTVLPADIASKCKWSPFLGYTFNNSVDTTIVNGNIIVKDGKIVNQSVFGKALEFDR